MAFCQGACELKRAEVYALYEAASHNDWNKVRPEIFGALFQDSMGKEERHAYGGHFTSGVRHPQSRRADNCSPIAPAHRGGWEECWRLAGSLTLTQKTEKNLVVAARIVAARVILRV